MGRRIEVDERIRDKRSRTKAYYKRKLGVMRKLVQLSKMCDKEVLLLMYDKETKNLV